jgi:hypothetical protein
MSPSLKRLALPIALVGVGTYALIGCIPLPGSYRPTEGGPRPEERIGDRSSKKPIRLGIATREQVESILGPPKPGLSNAGVAVYEYRVVTGTVIWPLCFTATRQTGERALRLQYGADGTLQRFSVQKL